MQYRAQYQKALFAGAQDYVPAVLSQLQLLVDDLPGYAEKTAPRPSSKKYVFSWRWNMLNMTNSLLYWTKNHNNNDNGHFDPF